MSHPVSQHLITLSYTRVVPCPVFSRLLQFCIYVSSFLLIHYLHWPRFTPSTTHSYPRFNRLTQICLTLPAFQAMFTPSLTHISPLWLNFSFLFTLCIPQMYDISFENCLFHLIIVSIFTHSWNTRTTSTNIIHQNKEIKKSYFRFFSPFT